MLLLLLLTGPKVDSENISTLQVLLSGSLLKTRAVTLSAGLMMDETHRPTLTATINRERPQHQTCKEEIYPRKLASLPSILAQWSHTTYS